MSGTCMRPRWTGSSASAYMQVASNIQCSTVQHWECGPVTISARQGHCRQPLSYNYRCVLLILVDDKLANLTMCWFQLNTAQCILYPLEYGRFPYWNEFTHFLPAKMERGSIQEGAQ